MFPSAAGPTDAAKQSRRVQQPASCLSLVQARLGSSAMRSTQFTREPQAAAQRPPSPTASPGVVCLLAAGLDPVVPPSHSPVTDAQGHTLIEHLFCARHSVHTGEQGACVIPDHSVCRPVHHCLFPGLLAWSVLCCKQWLTWGACYDLAISPASGLPPPRWRHGLLWSSVISTSVGNIRECILLPEGLFRLPHP